ncbi:hypothetical protein RJ640_028852, partial [Escallonia rubra]
MLFRRFCTSSARPNPIPSLLFTKFTNPFPNFNPNLQIINPRKIPNSKSFKSFSSRCKMGDARRPPPAPIPFVETADKVELYRALEASLGSPLRSDPYVPNPLPVVHGEQTATTPLRQLIIVISGPSGVDKDAVIKRLQEVRSGIHFEFLAMVEREELLEYALVYGDYKGIPKQQIREFMAKGRVIVLRLDIEGAATLRRILGRGEVGKVGWSGEAIIDAEKARVRQRNAVILGWMVSLLVDK